MSQARPSPRVGASFVAAAALAFAPLPWLSLAVYRASYLGLGRDQGIFQGTAWAVAHGARLYRDLREINGPLATEIHLVARLLGGSDPHVLRTFDLVVSALIFAFAGASLQRAIARKRGPSLETLAWAAAACSLMLAQYVSYFSFWELTQRESFYDWFLLGALGCDLRARGSGSAKNARRLLVLAGALSATPWFGKPTCALFTLSHFGLIAFAEPPPGLPRRSQFWAFGAGLALGALIQFGCLASFCDIPAFLRSYLVDNPRYYVYIWPRGLTQILTSEHATFLPLPLALSLGTLGLIAAGSLRRSLLGVALMPLLGIALDLLQNKAFPYHLHPVTAGTALLAIGLVCHVGTAADESGPLAGRNAALVALALASLAAYQSTRAVIASESLRADFAPHFGATRDAREKPDYLRNFERGDFPSIGLVDAGRFLRRYTRYRERIQMYGMDPYLLALAQRQSATPYIYNIDINSDAVVLGIQALGGAQSTIDYARKLGKAHAADLAARVIKSPPAAFVFFDNAPFTFPRSGLTDFIVHAPEAGRFVTERYVYAQGFGLVQVFMRKDLWPARQAAAPGVPK